MLWHTKWPDVSWGAWSVIEKKLECHNLNINVFSAKKLFINASIEIHLLGKCSSLLCTSMFHSCNQATKGRDVVLVSKGAIVVSTNLALLG